MSQIQPTIKTQEFEGLEKTGPETTQAPQTFVAQQNTVRRRRAPPSEQKAPRMPPPYESPVLPETYLALGKVNKQVQDYIERYELAKETFATLEYDDRVNMDIQEFNRTVALIDKIRFQQPDVPAPRHSYVPKKVVTGEEETVHEVKQPTTVTCKPDHNELIKQAQKEADERERIAIKNREMEIKTQLIEDQLQKQKDELIIARKHEARLLHEHELHVQYLKKQEEAVSKVDAAIAEGISFEEIDTSGIFIFEERPIPLDFTVREEPRPKQQYDPLMVERAQIEGKHTTPDWILVGRATVKHWARVDHCSYVTRMAHIVNDTAKADLLQKEIIDRPAKINAMHKKLEKDRKKGRSKKQSRAEFFTSKPTTEQKNMSMLDEMVDYINGMNMLSFEEFSSIVVAMGGTTKKEIRHALLTKVPVDSINFAIHVLDHRRLDPPEFVRATLPPTADFDRDLHQPIPLIENLWAMSHRDANKLVHSLNGNVDYVDSDVFFQDTFAVTPGTTTAEFLYTNNTGATIAWKAYAMDVVNVFGGAPTTGGFITTALQITAPGVTPTSINYIGQRHNTTANRLINPVRTGYSIGAFGLGVSTIHIEKQTTVILPPGHTAWACIFIPINASLTLNTDMLVSLFNANYRPFPPSEIFSIFLKEYGGTTTLSGTQKFLYNKLKEYLNNDDYITFNSKHWGGEIIRDGTYILKTRLRGGMLPNQTGNTGDPGVTGDDTKKVVEPPEPRKEEKPAPTPVKSATVVPEVKESAPSSKLAGMILEKMSAIKTGEVDKYFGNVNNSSDAIIESYISAFRPQATLFRNIGEQSLNQFLEEVLASKFNYGGTIYKSDCWSVINPSAPTTNTDVELSGPFANLNAYINTNDVINLSQYLRLDTSMANGDAMARVLASQAAKYKAGLVGSFAAPLLRTILMIHSLTPLLGAENKAISNTHPVLESAVPNVGGTMPGILLQPLTIPARIVDVNTLTAIMAGTYTAVVPPVEWAPSTWGVTTALVPVSFDSSNQPETAAAWSLSFMEYPFKPVSYDIVLADDEGVDFVESDHIATMKSSFTRVPGPYQKVLFVLTNSFNKGNAQLQYSIGTSIAPTFLNPATNGLDAAGVNVDILPSLNAFLGMDSSIIQQSLYQSYVWWCKFFGNDRDHTMAFMAAADHSHTLPWPIQKSSATGFLSNSAKSTGAVDWNTTGFSLQAQSFLDSATLSHTTCSGVPVTDLLSVQHLRCPLTTIPAYDSIAGVAAVWRVFNMKKPVQNTCPHIPAILARIKWFARCLTPLMDYALASTGLSASDMYAMSMLNSGLGKAQIVKSVRAVHNNFYRDTVQRILGCSPITNVPETWLYHSLPLWLDGALPNPNLGVMCMQRVPLPSLLDFINLDVPQGFHMSKIPCKYSVHASNSALFGEYTDFQIRDPYSDEAMAWKSITDTQWVTGDNIATPRLNLLMFLTNRTFALNMPFFLPLYTPSTSAAIYVQFSAYNVPDLQIVHPLKDIPAHAMLPNWSCYANMALTLAIDSPSPFYVQITRLSKPYYARRLMIKTDIPYGTAEVADQSEPISNGMGEWLGF